MTNAGARPAPAAWSGWAVAAVFLLAPIVAWLGPLGFAPLAGLAGLAALPGFRLTDRDRPAGLAILVALVWSVGSTLWSPYHPKNLAAATAVKMMAEAVLYGALIVAARHASPTSRRWTLNLLVWGMVALSALILVEAATGAGVYRALRDAMHDPIRPDLAVKNVAQALFILALFAPLATVAAQRIAGSWLFALPIWAAVIWSGHVFGYDAPILAAVVSVAAMGLVYSLPRLGPRLLAVAATAFFMLAPLVVWGARKVGWFDALQARVSLSWSERMGYWRHAQDWIGDHPGRGWGLDASRMFSPGIRLHPHDAALQIWLELGLIGAVAASVLWVAILAGLGRNRSDAGAAAAAGSGVAYLTFGAVSFGVWQEWWISLGALACAASIAVLRQPARN